MGEHASEWLEVSSGVPQGSIPGPLLFVIFINDLPDIFKNQMRLYADDSKIIAVIKNDDDISAFPEDIYRLLEWCKLWGDQPEF